MPLFEIRRHDGATGTTSRPVQRFGGLLIAAGGLFIAWMSFLQTLEHGRFLRLGAAMGPAFLVLGTALVLFPGYREERVARGEDVSALTGSALITPRWWGVVALAVVLGLAYSEFLKRGDLEAVAAALGMGR